MPSFSKTLEKAIHAALSEANERRHEIATIEHLLLALIDEPDAARVMKACAVDLDELRDDLLVFLDEEIKGTVSKTAESEAAPTKQFQRAVQRAAIHVQASGRSEVTGANILVGIFAELKSHAAFLLQKQKMTRYDAVNFNAHGIAKDPRYSKASPLPTIEREEEPTEELFTESEWRSKFEKELSTALKEPIVEQRRLPSSDTPFVFLSYAKEDRNFARGFLESIEELGLSFWWDQSIEPGDEWRTQIASKLGDAAVVLVLWTQNSIASKAVIEEASTAQSKRKLVHARLDDSYIPYGFSETQYVDLSDWDGSKNHPSFQRLLYAINDKLSAPTVSFATARIRDSSPVEVVAHNGRLAIRDAPANASASIVNPADLEERLAGLRQTIGSMCRMCADNTVYQLPPALHHCLDAIVAAATNLPVTWYALEDAKTLLQDCMDHNYASESWNTVVFNGLTKLIVRIDEIRPFLQPVQIDPETNAARPPVPEPVVTEEDIANVISLTEEAKLELSSDDGQSVVDENTTRLMERALDQMRQIQDTPDELKLFKFRRGLKNATYIVGGLVTAIGTGVVVNLLTAPTAAQTLLLRLKPIFESMLQFFF